MDMHVRVKEVAPLSEGPKPTLLGELTKGQVIIYLIFLDQALVGDSCRKGCMACAAAYRDRCVVLIAAQDKLMPLYYAI